MVDSIDMDFSSKDILDAVINYLFSEGMRIHKMDNKEFQKFCYGLNLYLADYPNYTLSQQVNDAII